MRALIIFISSFTVFSGFLFGLGYNAQWDGLKVRWDRDPSKGFFKIPNSTPAAVKDGFVKISECDVTAPWRGARYVKNGDRALTLLYDVNGFIAGIQASLPNNQPNEYPKAVLRPPFVADGNRWVVTAYFTDPSKICTTGRSTGLINVEGIGSNLYIQNGTSPESSIIIPRQEAGLEGTDWVEGKCFPTMGKHYWFNFKENMDCHSGFPVFLMYNRNELNGFGWVFLTDLSAPIFEHPSPMVHSLFMKTIPTCLPTAGRTTTLHFSLTNNVSENVC